MREGSNDDDDDDCGAAMGSTQSGIAKKFDFGSSCGIVERQTLFLKFRNEPYIASKTLYNCTMDELLFIHCQNKTKQKRRKSKKQVPPLQLEEALFFGKSTRNSPTTHFFFYSLSLSL